MKDLGIEDLNAGRPEDWDPVKFGRNAVDPTESNFTRVFTVGDQKGAKSYYFRQNQTSTEIIKKYVNCESFVIRACENSINTSVSTDAIPGRPK